MLRADIIPTDSSLSSTSTNAIQNKVVNSALDGKLSLSGGTMTGDIQFNKQDLLIRGITNDTYIEICPGPTSNFAAKTGASLMMTGRDYTGAVIPKGCFYLTAANEANGHKSLAGSPDGSLTWDGKTVERCLDFSFSGLSENIGYEDTYQGYVKFASGLQICFGATRTTKEGRTITFAKPFTVIPVVYASRASALIIDGPYVSADTATTTTISICQSFDASLAVSWLAIGR